jgi:DNA-binding winged helix-turn-helix (wHTH) protein
VVSRSMIIDRVWDQSFEGFTNIVDVYVRQLRRKIDEGFDPKLIRTVRGLRYSIDPEHTGGRYASPGIADLVAIRTPNRNMTASNTFPALKSCPENDWITSFSNGGDVS